jgi:hypothetical protein
MKSRDTLPPLTAIATSRLQQERERRRLALQNHVMATTAEASSPSATASNTRNPTMMAMKPIILSRKRRPGSGGIDRKKLTELLNEALSISQKFDVDSNRSSSANDDETTNNDRTVKK